MGLQSFDGIAVLGVGVALTNAGDGLSAALKVDPQEFHHGETIHLVIEAEVTKVRFDPVDKDDPQAGLRRVHIMRAGTAAIVDEALVADALRVQKLRLEAAADAEAGVQRIPGTVPELDELPADYDDGLGDDLDADADEIPEAEPS